MLRSCVWLLLVLILAAPAAAEQFSGLHMQGEVGSIISDGAQVGYVPVQISWQLTDPPGVYSTCYGDWQWDSAPVQVDVRRGDTREGELVATLSGSGQNGGVDIALPAPAPAQPSAYTAWLSGSVARPHSTQGDCVYDGVGEQDVRPLEENLPFALPYPDEQQCTFTVTRVQGRAGVHMPGQEASLPVQPGSTLTVGADLVVAPGGSVWMSNSVEGGSVVRVYSRTRLSLSAGDCRIHQRWSFKLWFGKVWSRVADLVGKPRNQVEIVTDNAAIGVRGTTFWIGSSGSGGSARTRLGVAQGRVQFWNRARPRQRRMVRAGQRMEARGSHAPVHAR